MNEERESLQVVAGSKTSQRSKNYCHQVDNRQKDICLVHSFTKLGFVESWFEFLYEICLILKYGLVTAICALDFKKRRN